MRLTKVEEVLGSDLMEDDRVMQSFIANFLTNFDREQRAKINLIQLVKTGMHQSKRKQRKVDQDIQELDYMNNNSQNVRYNYSNSTTMKGSMSSGYKRLSQSIKEGGKSDTSN